MQGIVTFPAEDKNVRIEFVIQPGISDMVNVQAFALAAAPFAAFGPRPDPGRKDTPV